MKKEITITNNSYVVAVSRPSDLTAWELEILITVLKKDLDDKRSEERWIEQKQLERY